jgi:hypothetical protein
MVFFCIQFEVTTVKSKQLFYKKKFYISFLSFCQDLELQVALTDRKKMYWFQKWLPIIVLMQIITLNHIKLDSKVSTNNQMYPK